MGSEYIPKVHAPAPWTLEGRAFGVLGILRAGTALEAGPQGTRIPRLAVICAVEYTSSPVGPYNEVFSLVFPVPGSWFQAQVTHMYVDSDESTYWGRRNWAVPKMTAGIELHWDTGMVSANLDMDGTHRCTLEFDTPRVREGLPVRLPANFLRIRQSGLGKHLITGLYGTGRVSPLHLKRFDSDGVLMPSRKSFIPLRGFMVRNFNFSMKKPLIVRAD